MEVAFWLEVDQEWGVAHVWLNNLEISSKISGWNDVKLSIKTDDNKRAGFFRIEKSLVQNDLFFLLTLMQHHPKSEVS